MNLCWQFSIYNFFKALINVLYVVFVFFERCLIQSKFFPSCFVKQKLILKLKKDKLHKFLMKEMGINGKLGII